jgi:hypothetical protein
LSTLLGNADGNEYPLLSLTGHYCASRSAPRRAAKINQAVRDRATNGGCGGFPFFPRKISPCHADLRRKSPRVFARAAQEAAPTQRQLRFLIYLGATAVSRLVSVTGRSAVAVDAYKGGALITPGETGLGYVERRFQLRYSRL